MPDMEVNDEFKLFSEVFVEEYIETTMFEKMNSNVLSLYIHLWKCGPLIAECLGEEEKTVYGSLLPSNEMLTIIADKKSEDNQTPDNM